MSLSSGVFVPQKRKGPRLSGSTEEYSSLRDPLSRPNHPTHPPPRQTTAPRPIRAGEKAPGLHSNQGALGGSPGRWLTAHSSQLGVGWVAREKVSATRGTGPLLGGLGRAGSPSPDPRSPFKWGLAFCSKGNLPRNAVARAYPKVYPETERTGEPLALVLRG